MELETATDGEVHVENIGGIDETTVEFSPGVTLLVGRNATNRTSFLRAVMAVLGSAETSLKGDADAGRVALRLGGETYTRRLSRRSGTVVTDGEPYLADGELADLFAFLLESNEARRAVARNDDLRDLIMRPVDTEAIEAEIESLVADRRELEAELEAIDDLKAELPGLEEQRTDLRERIEAKRATLKETEAELEAANADVEETREEKAELEEKLAELRSKRSTLEDIRFDLETERESLEALRRERGELETDREALPETPAGEREEIAAEIRSRRERKQRLESEVNELQSVISFNEEVLAEAGSDASPFAALDDGDDAVTDRLVEGNRVSCWTCGSEVDREQVEATLDQLRSLSQEKMSEVSDLEGELDTLTERERELERAQHERDRTERRLREIESEIEESEATIEDLRTRRAELTDEIETVEAEVEQLEEADYGAVLDLHKEANQLEYELGRLETDLESVEAEIADAEARLDERGEIEARLDGVESELTDLRTRIDRIEERAAEAFNEEMATVLDLLDYANLDRIWIERVSREVREGRRTVERTAFELHVIRRTDSGTAYEDTVDHLSESEREVTGLVFALAGYLAHEVYETIPFMLLDSLEAIDADRIAALVSHLQEYPGYLLVALLPEDAAALDEEYQRITGI
jgi:chromosome segregation ATPase